MATSRELLARARAALNAGDLDAASADLDRAYRMALETRDRLLEAEALASLARVLAVRGATDQAVLAAESGVAAARAARSPLLEADARLAEAEARVRLGDAERARIAAGEAVALLDDSFSAARAGGDLDGAVALADRALAARALLARLPAATEGVAGSLARREEERREDRQRRADRALLEKLFSLARRLAAERDPERVIAAVLESAVEASGAERGFLLLSPGEGEEAVGGRELPSGLTVVAARNFDRALVKQPEFKVSSTVIEKALATMKPVLVRDASAEGAFAEQSSVVGHRLRSIVAVPFQSPRQHGVRGLLYLDNRFGEAAFTEEDLPAFATFAAHAALAVENARLAVRAAAEHLEAGRARARAEELARKLAVKLEETQDRLRETTSLLAQRSRFAEIVGGSAPMEAVYKLLDRFKGSDAPVLIRGESGTGKELVARAVHFEGPRGSGPFVSESCAAIAETLLESTLFGHEAGAFTNALERRAGLFELATGGTLFLDEIGELTPACQAKLLRVLQESRVRRVGGSEEIPVSVRVIAATHRDLEQMVRDGRFREDLYFRLNVLSVRLPPLRERRDDIPALMARFFDAHAKGRKLEVAPDALRALLNHSWPGNVRELENEVKRFVALGTGALTAADLSPSVIGAARAASPSGEAPLTLEEAERRTIIAALKASNWNKVRAADILGIPRPTLYHRLKHHRIVADDVF